MIVSLSAHEDGLDDNLRRIGHAVGGGLGGKLLKLVSGVMRSANAVFRINSNCTYLSLCAKPM